MMSFYLPLCVMITVYVKILGVVRSKIKAITLQIGQVKALDMGKIHTLFITYSIKAHFSFGKSKNFISKPNTCNSLFEGAFRPLMTNIRLTMNNNEVQIRGSKLRKSNFYNTIVNQLMDVLSYSISIANFL